MTKERIQINVWVPAAFMVRLRKWLTATGRDAHGAISAEIRRMLEEGMTRRERKGAR